MINQIMGSLSTLFTLDNTQQGLAVQQPDLLSTQAHISTIAPGAEQWGRRDWRRWRKLQGLSKQEARNVRALALVGTQAPRDVSRSDLRRIESNVKAQTPGMALYADVGRQAGRKVNQITDILEGIASRHNGQPLTVNTDPIEIEEEVIEEEPLPGQAPVQPVSPITYEWGNQVNAYWKDLNEKVLKALPEELLRQIDTNNDSKLDPNELMAWQQSIGAGNDLKFGSGTIGAASAKYGNSFNASGFKGYTNPGNTLTKDNGSPVKSTSRNPVHTNNGTSINTTGTGVMGSTNLMYEWGKKINNWWNSL